MIRRGPRWWVRNQLDARRGFALAWSVARLDRDVLRDVSRSFYLSLRLLPGPMWPATATGYLLARASDTLADTHAVPVDSRIVLLDAFADEIDGGSPEWRHGSQMEDFRRMQKHSGEKVLLGHLDGCMALLRDLPSPQSEAVRRVLRTIIGGQKLDLVRFGHASLGRPVRLESDADLEDYCYRVAGCVGRFWTEIGFLTLGRGFASLPEERMIRWGESYGKGLQLVNILRDLPEDLTAGRCYLPVHPDDSSGLVRAFAEWKIRAESWLEEGERYASCLPGWRLRVASVLPALIGRRTLDRLAASADPLPPPGVKVSRREVRAALWEGICWRHQPPTTSR